MRLLLLALLLPVAAIAQPATPDGSEEAESDTTVTVSASPFFTFATLADSVRASARLATPPSEPVEVEEVVVPTPTLHVIGTAGVTFLAPVGWEGTTSVVEGDDYAMYSASNVAFESPLAGVTVRVERVTGLNPLLRERFRRGQTSYGYHGTTPVGPADVPRGLGIEVSGPGTGGAVAFLERGPELWTMSVQAPTAIWVSRRADVLALLSAIRIP